MMLFISRKFVLPALSICLSIGIVSPVAAQITVYSTRAATGNKPKDGSKRAIAALDIALQAAANGLADVSFEAVRRAVGSGPPVSAVDLGGLLGSNSANSAGYGGGFYGGGMMPTQSGTDDQRQLAAKLYDVHEAWKKHDFDANACCNIWVQLIFPEKRPNEAFAYSTHSRNTSYSYSVSLDVQEPEPINCGARALAEWAIASRQVDQLKELMQKRKRMPAAQSTVLLLELILAAETSESDLVSLCKQLKNEASGARKW